MTARPGPPRPASPASSATPSESTAPSDFFSTPHRTLRRTNRYSLGGTSMTSMSGDTCATPVEDCDGEEGEAEACGLGMAAGTEAGGIGRRRSLTTLGLPPIPSSLAFPSTASPGPSKPPSPSPSPHPPEPEPDDDADADTDDLDPALTALLDRTSSLLSTCTSLLTSTHASESALLRLLTQQRALDAALARREREVERRVHACARLEHWVGDVARGVERLLLEEDFVGGGSREVERFRVPSLASVLDAVEKDAPPPSAPKSLLGRSRRAPAPRAKTLYVDVGMDEELTRGLPSHEMPLPDTLGTKEFDLPIAIAGSPCPNPSPCPAPARPRKPPPPPLHLRGRHSLSSLTTAPTSSARSSFSSAHSLLASIAHQAQRDSPSPGGTPSHSRTTSSAWALPALDESPTSEAAFPPFTAQPAVQTPQTARPARPTSLPVPERPPTLGRRKDPASADFSSGIGSLSRGLALALGSSPSPQALWVAAGARGPAPVEVEGILDVEEDMLGLPTSEYSPSPSSTSANTAPPPPRRRTPDRNSTIRAPPSFLRAPAAAPPSAISTVSDSSVPTLSASASPSATATLTPPAPLVRARSLSPSVPSRIRPMSMSAGARSDASALDALRAVAKRDKGKDRERYRTQSEAQPPPTRSREPSTSAAEAEAEEPAAEAGERRTSEAEAEPEPSAKPDTAVVPPPPPPLTERMSGFITSFWRSSNSGTVPAAAAPTTSSSSATPSLPADGVLPPAAAAS